MMKRLFSSLALTAISIVSVNAQTYTHPTVGQQNTYAGTCEVNTCSGTYYDNGGVGGSAVASGAAGNYTNNINAVYRTFCPSTPGGRVSLTFTAFTLENPGGGPGPGGCWDYMQIGNGPTQNSPVIAQGCGTSLNGATVTSTDASGCLTIRFTSDNTINRLGWAATISCVAGGGPSGTDNYDCINATGICDNGFSFSGLSDGPGLISDDCGGASCVVSENFSNWYEFTVQTSGTLGFDIQVGASGDDYDFAVYQSNSCSALGAPVRCSYAATAGATGLGNGAVDNSEDVSGDGWVAGMNVTAGQHYYLLINEWTPNNSTFTLNWTGTATVNTPTPGFTIGATNYTSPAAYSVCQGDPLTIFANGTGGTYSWWTAPVGGVNLANGISYSPPTGAPGSTNYYLQEVTSSGCTSPRGVITVTVTAPPSATISYASPFCTTAGPQNVTQTGTAGGTYSAAPAGLTINAASGQITPSTSTAGTYTVTYSIPAAGGCAAFSTTASVTITQAPSATISYSGSPWCTTAGVQNVTQTGTAGGTYTAAPAGLSINAATGQITPSTSSAGTYTVTYTIAASGGCAAFTTTASVTITTAPSATISYSGSPWCTTAGVQNVTQTGTAGGTYTAAPAGLSINAATGQITPSTSSAGTYTVTYTIAASGGCAAFTTTASVTITAAPSATISYAGSPFCTTAGPANVTQTGTAGGTYTAAPAGLTINAATGQITPGTSTAGTYTVTYTIAASGGCAAYTTTASVTITTAPSATISYSGSPWCTTAGVQNVTQTGTAGGTYTAAPAGLSINAATGQITPSTSSAGTYTVTYTIAASGGCAAFTTTASVTITAAPSATISYAGSPFCTTAGPANVTQTGTAGGTYTAAPAGLTINAATGQITPSTSSAGTYTVTYTIAASGGCAAFTTTASVTITAAPSATISYAGSPFCTTSGPGNVTQTGTAGGTYTAAPAGLTINAATGQVTPGTSTAGTYTVTYTIPASGGCAVFTTTASVTITAAPSATISYAGSPFCTSSGPVSVTQTGTAGGTYTAAPAGLTINAATGQITPGTSTAGTYTVTYTIAASGGCAAFTTTASVTITQAPSATISYSSPYCSGLATPQSPTITGTAGGTFTSAPAGLTINAATGDVTPSTSTAGTYTVTYSIPASGGCAAFSTTASVTITNNPSATISYSGSPYCSNLGSQAVTLTGSGGGTFTSAPAGLSLNAATGAVNPSASSAGTYTVTYSIPASGGCAAFSTTASVTITTAPSATISYAGSPFCTTAGPANVTQTGTAGGTYTAAPAGLTINAATGQITPGTSTAGTYTVTYTIAASGGCPVFTTTASVTITAAPSATISYPGSPFCSTSGPVNVTQTGTAGGTYTAAPAGLTINAATGQITPGTSTAGTYTVTYSIAASGGCAAFSTTASVTITAPPTIANSGPPQTICETTGSVTMAGNTPTVGTGSWSQISGPVVGTITTPGSPTTTITGLTSPGAYVFQWAISNPPCTPSTSNVTITVNPAPTASSAGPAQTICSSVGTVTMAANAPTVGTGLWTQTGGPAATITTPTSPTTTITGLTAAGTYTFSWTISNAPCAPSSSSVTITVNANPAFAIGATVNPSGCGLNDGSITLTGLSPSTNYTITYDDGSIVNLGSVTTTAGGTYTITGLGAGTYSNFVVTSTAGCATTVNGPVNLVDPSAPTGTVSASTNPTTCGGTDGTITISGLTPSSTYDISYSDGSSTITLTGVTSTAGGTYTITGLAAGTYSGFSLTLAGCTGAATGSATLSDPASPTFTSGATFTNPTSCGAADGTITLSGLLPSTSYNLSYDGPSGTVVVGNITTDASGNYVITGLVQGSYTNFVITATNNCSTTSTTNVTLTDPSAPVFTAGSSFTDPTTCNGTDGTITISGLNPSTTYDISYNGPSGVVTLTGVTTDASGNYVITGLGAGTYNNFIVSLAGCNGNSGATTVTLTDPTPPTFSAGTTSTNPTTCGGSDGTITISGLAPSTNYNIAYDGPSGTVNLGTVTTDASGNYVITGLPSGTYFNFSVTQSGCTTVDAVTSVNLTDPGAPTFTISGTGTNPTTCGGTDGSFDITGLMPNTTYDFIYDDGSGPVTVTGTTDASGNYTVTGLAAGTYTNISVSLLGCTSVNSTTITLTDPGLPAFTVTGTNPTTCGATDGTITFSGLTPSTSYNYSYFDGTTTVTATVTSDASGNIIITGLAPGTYDQFSLVTSGCTGTSATVITLTDPGAPAAPVAGTNASYCQGDVMADLTATAGSGGTLTWYSDAGLTTVIGTGTTLTPSATLGSTTYYVTETTGSCESAASTVTITINTIPSAPVAGTDASYCSTDAFAAMTATPGSGGTINWYTDPGLTVLVGSGNNFTPLNVIGTTVYYVTEDVSGCESTTPATVTIIITDCDTLQVEIPTGFTPDGDGINDTWNILNLNSKFPNNHVEVFNRWGAKLFESDGYATPWDGTYKGNLMPVASYYFVIDFGDGSEPRKGTVTIIR